ncbi:MAG: invasin domain 3-containing protein [Anaerolineae bacterium]
MPYPARRMHRRAIRVFVAALAGPAILALALLALPGSAAALSGPSSSSLSSFSWGASFSTSSSPVLPDLAIIKSVNQSTVAPGGALTYTIAYSSVGALSSSVRLTDTLPANTTWVTDTAQSVGLTRVSTSPLVWSAPEVLTDTGGAFSVVVAVSPLADVGTELLNRVSIRSASQESNYGNNLAGATSVVVGADIRLSLSGPAATSPGWPIVYHLAYTNSGNVLAAGVVVTDSLPAAVTFGSASGGGAWDGGARQVTWSVGDVPPNGKGSLAITGTVSSSAAYGPLVSAARVSAPGDVNSANDNATWTTTIGPPAPASIALASSGALVAGRPVTITATVRDVYNNLVPDGVSVAFSAPSPATITSPGVTSGGQASAVLRTTRKGPLTVSATAGAANAILPLTFGPAAPAQLGLAASASAVVGQSVSVTAVVSDTYGNTVADGTIVGFTATGAGVNPSSAATTNGRAATMLSTTTAGPASVTAQVGGLQSSRNVTFQPAAAAQIDLAASRGQLQVGPTVALTATVRDSFGNPANPTRVVFSTTRGQVTPLTVNTASGVARAVLSNTVAGAATVTARADGVAAAATTGVTFDPAGAANLSLAAAGSATVGQPVTVTVTVADAWNNMVADGTPVQFGLAPSSVGTLDRQTGVTVGGKTTVIVRSTVKGTATVTALTNNHQSSAAVVFLPAAPASLDLTMVGDPVAGAALPVRARVMDAYQNGVAAGVPVQFSVITGAAVLAPTTAPTDATGVATTTLTATSADTVIYQARAGSAAKQGSVAIQAGKAVKLRLTANPAGVTVDGGTTQITVEAVDAFNNRDTTRSGAVALSFTSPVTGTLNPASITLNKGVATTTLTAPNIYSAGGLIVQGAQPGLTNGQVTIPLLPADVTVAVTAPGASGPGAYATPGQTLTYSVAYSNTGQAAARNVQLYSTLPDRLTNVQVLSTPPGVSTISTPSGPGGSWHWSIGTLPPQARGQIVIQATIDPNAPWGNSGSIQGDASITTDTAQKTGAGSAPDTTGLYILVLSSDVRLIVAPLSSDQESTLKPGSEIPYAIYLSNASPAAVSQARITVTLPLSTTFTYFEARKTDLSAPGGEIRLINPTTGQTATSCSRVCVWTYDGSATNSPISSNTNSYILLKVKIDNNAPPGRDSLLLVGQITSPVFDRDLSNNTLVVARNIYGPNLVARGSAPGAAIGDTTMRIDAIAYNLGMAYGTESGVIHGGQLVITLPPSVQFVGSTPPVTQTGQVLTYAFSDDLTPNDGNNSKGVSIDVRVPSGLSIGAVLTTTIQATTTTPEPYRGDNTMSLVTRVIPDKPNQVQLQPGGTLTLQVDGPPGVLTARALDPNNNLVPGWPVNFIVTPGGSPPLITVQPSSAQTGASGTVTTTVSPGTRVGDGSVTATIVGKNGTTQAVTSVRVLPGGPYTVTASLATADPLVVGSGRDMSVSVTDRYGNPVSDGTVVTLTTTLGAFQDGQGGSGSPLRTTTTGGVIHARYNAGTLAGIARIGACAQSGRCTAFPATVLSGAPFGITTNLSRVEAQAGDEPLQVTVDVVDQFGNRVGNGEMVTLSVDNCPTALLQPTTAPTVDGRVSASLGVGTMPCQGVVHADAGGHQAAPIPFRVTPADPQTLTVTAPPSLMASGVQTGTVWISLRDRFLNGIDSVVSLQLAPELGSLAQTEVQTVNGTGRTTLTSPRALGSAVLSAQVGSLTASTTVQYVAGPPTYLSMLPNRPTLAADGVSTLPLTVNVVDAYGNPAGGFVTLASNMGTSVTPPSGALQNGLFQSALAAGTVAGTANLTATIASAIGGPAAITETFPVRLKAGPPAIMLPTLDRYPARLVADGSDHLTLSLRILDRFSNPVDDGTPVSFRLQPGYGALSKAQAATAAGDVSVTVTAGTTPGVSATLTADAGTTQISRAIDFVVGPPGSIHLSLSSARVPAPEAGITATVAVTATVTDRLGRPVAAGTPVTFGASRGTFLSGGATLQTQTNAAGRAYATYVVPSQEGEVSVTVTAGTATARATLGIGVQPYRSYLPLLFAGR